VEQLVDYYVTTRVDIVMVYVLLVVVTQFRDLHAKNMKLFVHLDTAKCLYVKKQKITEICV